MQERNPIGSEGHLSFRRARFAWPPGTVYLAPGTVCLAPPARFWLKR